MRGMNEGPYRILGWGCLLVALAGALSWCLTESGPAGWLMDTSGHLLKTRLVQFSWLFTFAIVGLPGYLAKRYFDGLAWTAHVKNMPPPNPQESAKRSKYVKVEPAQAAPPPPSPVKVSELPKGQEEFIATCPGCGNFFPALKGADALKCPNCGEALPTA